MSKKRFLDTNLIVRHLVQDHPEHAKAAGRLFNACDRGDLELVILPAVLAECVFVLESFYKHRRPAIADALARLIASRGVEMAEVGIYADALARFRSSKAHFVDCVIAAFAAAEDIPVASFDHDFKKFADVKVSLSD